MLFVKIIGILFLCSVAATDMVTFKPFLKSRYSLRERRAKSTTRSPLIKLNDTTSSEFSTTEAETQSISTQAPTQLLETTKEFTGNHLQDSFDHSSTENTMSTVPATATTAAATTELVTASVEIKLTSNTPAREVVNLENEVTTERVYVAEPTTAKKQIETTTQTEWLYDYYASDDESPKRDTSV